MIPRPFVAGGVPRLVLPDRDAVDQLDQPALLDALVQFAGLLEYTRARLAIVAARGVAVPDASAPLLLSADEAATRTGLLRRSLMRAARQRRIRSHPWGRYRLFDPAELAEDVKRLRADATIPIHGVCPAPSSADSAGTSGSRKPRSARSSA